MNAPPFHSLFMNILQKDSVDSGPSKSPQMNNSKNIKNKKQNANNNNNKKQKTNSSSYLLDIHSQQVVQSLCNLPPNAISFVSLNVCGMSSSNRQLALLTIIQQRQFTFIGVQDTQIASHHSLHNFKQNKEYDSWWSIRSQSNQNTGVGILIQKQFSKYVQKVYKISARIIFIDLFFPGRKKLRFFSLYAPQ